MKNHENHLQVINSTLKLHSQMYLHSFIVYFFVFASGLFIGITINFSLRNTPVHSQISQFSLGFSPPPAYHSHIIVDETKLVTKNDSNESPQTMDIVSNDTEVPQTMDIVPNDTEVPQTTDIANDTEVLQTMDIIPNDKEVPQTMDIVPNDTEVPQTMNIEQDATEIPNDTEVPQTMNIDANGAELPNDTEVPQTMNIVPNDTDVPQTMNIESNGTDVPNDTQVPQTMNIVPNDTEVPQTMNIEANDTEVPETMNIVSNDTEVPQTMNIESNGTEVPQTMNIESNDTELPNGAELSQTMQVEPNGTENNTELALNEDPNGVEDVNDETTDHHELISRGIANMHNISDNALIARALTVDHENDENQITPKIAFMFLTRGNLHLAPLWDMFFKGHEGFYSIYVHTQPNFNGTFPENSVFHGRRIPSQKVEWGKFTMIEAEKRLLANALLDISNQRFVLLSESCIPLFNFSTVYSYLLNSTQNFVEAYDMPGPVGRGRYNHRMQPDVELDQWRKGSQWFQMNRELAVEVVSDQKYMALFKRFCKPACYSDEHYIPTFVSMFFWEKNSNRTLTWVDWAMGGPHPTRFGRYEVTPDLLKGMRRSTKKCLYNGKETSVCFMFARKFLPNAVDRLLRIAPKIMKF